MTRLLAVPHTSPASEPLQTSHRPDRRMADQIDWEKKEWRVLNGPLNLFGGCMIAELLDPGDELDATFLVRVVYPVADPSNKLGKKHPLTPPLHIHLYQAESFKVIQGKFGVTSGWDQKDTILTSESPVNTVEPYVPHTPWTAPCDEDTIVYVWAHPSAVAHPLGHEFFSNMWLYMTHCYDRKKDLDPLQMTLAMHDTGTIPVMLPGLSFLGPLRWWIPHMLQSSLAPVARMMGYSPIFEPYAKAQ